MKRTLAAFGTAFLAGVLSLTLAVPANAADPFVPDPPKTSPTSPYYKYGFDYYRPVTGGTPAGPSSPWPRQYLNVNINPSAPGAPSVIGSIPQNGGTVTLNPANKPLTGKIIEPGKTIVKAPSVYKPTTGFFGGGALGLARLLGTAGVGLGGVATPPANLNELALAKGVPQSCIDGTGTCTQAQEQQLMKITNCGHLSGADSCDSIGAKQSDGAPFSDWLKDVVVPFATDLWCSIIGQCGPKADENGHIAVNQTKGCVTTYGVQYRGENNITVGRAKWDLLTPRPTGMTDRAWWDEACSAAKVAVLTGVSTPGTLKTECINPSTGKITTGSGQYQGIMQSITTVVNPDGTNKIGLCPIAGTVLYSVKIYNASPQSHYDQASTYAGLKYSEWVNPDPNITTMDDTKITTSWTCQGSTGATVNYSKSVTSTAAFVDPVCPPGSTLLNHKVESSSGNGVNTRTLDQGAQDSGAAAAFPLCLPPNPGCSMTVQVDGQTCTATRTECQTWPAVNGSTPSRVQCKWGTYTVPTTDCLAMLPNAYKSEVGTVYDPKSQTWTAIDTYGNPVPSNPQPWNPANPNPVPGTNVGTPPATTPGTSTGFPTEGTNPNDNCVPGGWSWNPVDWVKNPVICALQEAFVPKTDVAARLNSTVGAIQEKPPFSWFVPVWVPPSAASCPDWNVTIPGVMSKNVVCESSFTAAIVGVRSGLFGLVATAMVWPLIRGIWYAAIPVLRVQAGGSK